jgi:hypothetical protein
MSEDGQPADERGQDELIAAFAALGGKLTKGELVQLLGSEEYHSILVRLATLLLDGDAAVAEEVRGTRWPPCSRRGAAWLTPARRASTCTRHS